MKHFLMFLILLLTFTVLYLLSKEFNPEAPGEDDTQKESVSDNADHFKHSFSDEKSSNEKSSTLLEKKFYEFQDELCEGSNKKYEDLANTLDNYIQRYISLFLIASDLASYEVEDLEKIISVDVELTIKAEDLAFLQNYSKAGKDSSHLRSLSKLDAIFSNIAKNKKKSLLERSLQFSLSCLANLIHYVFTNPSFLHYMPLLIILLMVLWIYYYVNPNPYLCLLIIINCMMIWDSAVLYWKKVKETDLDIYVKLLQMKEIPEDCDPSNMSWYKKLLAPFFKNDCLQYYLNLHKSAMQEVSILTTVVETYAFYLIETPAKVLGASVRLFSGEVGALWHGPLKYFVNILFVPLFSLLAVIFILILCGKRFRLSFLWSSLEIGDSNSSTGNKDALPSAATPKATRDIRKLRPWTKPRSNTRLKLDFRKRFSLRALKQYPQAIDLVKLEQNLRASRHDTDPEESSSSDSTVKQTDKIKNLD